MERDHGHGERTDARSAAKTDAPGIAIDGTWTAVIAGTEIAARRIAALLDGDMDVAEILRDYMSLTRDQVLAAKAYADRYTWTGMPYLGITAKMRCDISFRM